MIAIFLNLYKNNPIKFFMMIAIIYLLLKQTKVVENLTTDQVDLTAISTVSQLATKWDKAVGIDPHGNVTFKKNIAAKQNLIVDGKVGIGTKTPATKLEVKSAWNDLLTIRPNNGKSVKFITGTGNFGIMVNDGTKEAISARHNNGNVGIGTNNPTTKLDVVGKITTPDVAKKKQEAARRKAAAAAAQAAKLRKAAAAAQAAHNAQMEKIRKAMIPQPPPHGWNR